jgi:hypothetical protein
MSPDLLASLRAAIAEGSTVRTVSNGAPNLVTSIEPSGVWIETDRTRAHGEGAKLVPAWMLQLAWTELRSRGKLSADFLREREVRRSSAVLALLAALPGVGVVSTRPIELALIDSSSGRTPEERVVPPDDDALTVSGRWSARSAGPRVGLVGCVKSKQPRRARAADLYTSALFRGRRSFVESTCDRWSSSRPSTASSARTARSSRTT